MPSRKKRLIVTTAVISAVFLLLASPLLLYVPAVQQFTIRHIVDWLNSGTDDLKYSVGRIRLDFPMRLRVDDVVAVRSGSDTIFSLGSLRTGLDDIPMGGRFFVARHVSVEDVRLRLPQVTDELTLYGNVPSIDINSLAIDPNGEVKVAGVRFVSPALYVGLRLDEESADDTEGGSWRVSVDRLHLRDARLAIDLDTVRSRVPWFDYNHMRLDSVTLDAGAIVYDGDMVEATIHSLQLRERRSDMTVDNLRGSFVMNGSELRLSDFYLRMPHTELSADAAMDYRYFDAAHDGYLRASVDGTIASPDFKMHVAPYLYGLSDSWPDQMLNVRLSVDADGQTLRPSNVHLSLADHFSVDATVESEHLWSDSLRVASASVRGRLDEADFLLTGLVAPPAERAYRLPSQLDVDATLTQHGDYLTATADIQKSGRQVGDVEAALHRLDETYHVRAALTDVSPSDYVPILPIDELTMNVVADGRGFDLKSRRARLEASATIDTLVYTADGHRDILTGLNAEASLVRNQYVARLLTDCPYLVADGQLSGHYSNDSLTARGLVRVGSVSLDDAPVDFGRIGGTFGMRSHVVAHYDWHDVADIRMRIDSISYGRDAATQALQPVTLDVHSRQGSLTVRLAGGDADVRLEADAGLEELQSSLVPLSDQMAHQMQTLRFDLDTLVALMPRLSLDVQMAQYNPFYPFLQLYGVQFVDADVRLRRDRRLTVDASVEDIAVGDFMLDTLRATLRPLASGYDYNLHAAYLDPKPGHSYSMTARGQILGDSLSTRFRYVNGKHITMYDLGATLALDGDTATLRLLPSPLVYGQPFAVNDDNYIRVTSFKNLAERSLGTSAHVEMRGPHELDLLLLTSPRPERRGNELMLALHNLDLDYLDQTLQWGKSVGGRADVLFNALAVPDSVSGNLLMRLRDAWVGQWSVDSVRVDGDVAQYRVDEAFHTQVNAKLAVDTLQTVLATLAKQDSMLLRATIDHLPLALANIFMPDGILLSGGITGRVEALKEPSLAGHDAPPMQFNASSSLSDATLTYLDAAAVLRLPADTLRLVDGMLQLDDYRIAAAGGNPLVLSGFVDMRRDVANPTMSLSLRGDGVRLINNSSRTDDSQIIVGTLPVNTNIRVAGASSSLRVTGSVSALSGTSLTYWLQDDALSSNSQMEGLAEFVRFDQLDRKPRTVVFPLVAAEQSGIDVELRLDIARNARILVNLPTSPDDHATIVGGGSLEFGSKADGTLTLNGTYDATGGDVYFRLPVLPITKSFAIVDPSSVVFSGPIDQPELNLVATEDVRCTISDAAGGTRVVKFVVYVYIRGTLDKMDVTFSCAAPEDASMQSQIDALTDEERTRQAINLLVTQTYTGPGVTSNAGVASANAALNSLLQKEVESLVSQKLKHTDISVGIDTYDATGAGSTRTDYNVKVSQRLFNDKVRVTVGGRMSSGDDDGTEQRDNAVINDVSLEWLLDDDASRYVRLFRKTNYESVLEGEVVEMGVGYVMQRRSFRLRDLFVWNTKKRQQKIAERIRQLEAAASADNHTNMNDGRPSEE